MQQRFLLCYDNCIVEIDFEWDWQLTSEQMTVVTEKLENIAILDEGTSVKIAGRIISKRSFGKFMFLNLYDVKPTNMVE